MTASEAAAPDQLTKLTEELEAVLGRELASELRDLRRAVARLLRALDHPAA